MIKDDDSNAFKKITLEAFKLAACFLLISAAISLLFSLTRKSVYSMQIEAAEKMAEETFGVKARISNNRIYLYEVRSEECVKTINSQCPTYEQHLLTVVTDTSPENMPNLPVYIKASAPGIMLALKRSKDSVQQFYEPKRPLSK